MAVKLNTLFGVNCLGFRVSLGTIVCKCYLHWLLLRHLNEDTVIRKPYDYLYIPISW